MSWGKATLSCIGGFRLMRVALVLISSRLGWGRITPWSEALRYGNRAAVVRMK